RFLPALVRTLHPYGVLGIYATSSGCCVTLRQPLRDAVVQEFLDQDGLYYESLGMHVAREKCIHLDDCHGILNVNACVGGEETTGESIMSTLGERLRAAREKRGWTQEEVARRAQLPRQAISRLERGERTHVRSDVLGRLAMALAVSADFLLSLDTPEQ